MSVQALPPPKVSAASQGSHPGPPAEALQRGIRGPVCLP